ncbi:gliding motility-associated C-terminal domain-containing protein [Lutimonas sp.]|uniref:T9SS type B sorting domain-containing protein n=1 Tax=Lutimonas sp. TaxID=1872403 RepID=UPI003D9B8AB3
MVTNLPDVTGECSVTVATVPTATDGCAGVIINGTTSDPTTYTAIGTYTITWTYTGSNTNITTQTQTVIVTDTTAPVADNATLADVIAQCEVTVLTAPTATDNCGGLVTVTNDAVLPISGSTLVTWTYTDAQGNTSTQTQNIVINDTTAPVADTATLADVIAQCEVTALTAPTATDNCGGAVTVTSDAALPINTQGTTVVTWTYEDAQGNASTQAQNVVITDTTAPLADTATLADVIAQCEVTALTAPTATDNCGGLVTITNDAVLPITAQGTTVVTWTYEDAQGNSSTQAQNVIIDYLDAPVSAGDQVICEGDVIPTLVVSVNAGETVDWYDAAIGGNLVLSDNTDYTPSTAGTYYAETRSETSVCVSPSRTAVILTENALPTIDNVVANDPTLISCPALDNGSIVITATGSNLEYSIDNGTSFQSSNTFSGLVDGNYEVVVRDAISTCSIAYGTTLTLTAPNCVAEIVVSITQDSGPSSANAIGQDLGYTVVIENSGTLDVNGLNIVNTQPDGTLGTLVGPIGDAGTPGVIDIGETWTYTVVYTTSLVDFQNGIDLVNAISVTSVEILTPEVDEAVTELIVSDLSLTKTIDNANPVVGTDIVFTIVVANDGKSDVTGVQVTDLLPSGYTYVGDDAAGDYNSVTGIWNAGSILNGANTSLNITATVNAAGDYTNVAEITASDNLDSDSFVNNGDISEDDQDDADTTPQASSDLSLTKVVDNASPNVGADVTFTITVANNGPSDATGIQVVDMLPTGYAYVSDDAAGAYVSGTGVWTVGNVNNASSATLTIVATVNVTGDYNNIAEITAADNIDNDSTPGNGDITEDDMDNAVIVPNPVSDIELTLDVDNASPLVGDNVVFTVTITNNGPSVATGIEITDVLPSGYTYVSDDVAGNYVSASGLWTVGSINAAGNSVLNITATVNATGDYNNIAEVTASVNLDPDSTPNNGDLTEDDMDEITTTPIAVSDISLTKTVDNATPFVASNVVFTIVVDNQGPSEATGIIVTDILTDGYTYVSDDSSNAYDALTGIWNVGTIAAGASGTINITATVNVSGDYSNTAEVTSADNLDPDSTPNNGDVTEDDMDNVITNPIPVSDMEINMTVDTMTPYVGGEVVFTIEVSNIGPSPATGIEVIDLLPSGYAYVSDDSGNYSDATGIWTAGDIAAGAMSTINITASVNPTGNYTNIAEVFAADNVDPDSTPNNGIAGEDDQFEITTTPIPVADVSLVKTVNDMNPTTGDTVTFTLSITNDGPSTATGVAVEEIVPDGFGNISPISAGSSLNGSTIGWSGLTISSGATVVLEYSAEVLTTGTYINQAEIIASDVIDFDSEPSVSFDTDDYADGEADDDESIIDDMVINFLPTAVDDDVIVVENTIENGIMVLIDNGNGADDFGGDGPGTVPVVIATTPSNGVATVNDNGSPDNPTDDYIMYTPNTDFVGFDSFTYTIEDGQGLIGSVNGDRSTATVTIEVLVDTDGDMVGDIYDIDDDNDGILDTAEGNNDSDGDSYADSLDLDSDNDGLPDNVEAQETASYLAPSGIDTDRNGLDDAYETTAGSGEGLVAFDNDGDAIADYLDSDSDNDNVPDSLEGHDADHDSLPDAYPLGSDADEDGLDDGYEGSDINDGFDANDEIDDPSTLPNADNDALPDYRDMDDDNDGIATIDEDLDGDNDPTTDDTDGDIVRNYLDVDDDNDGILTRIEGDNDEDRDGFADYLDLDADADGIPDNIEGQTTEAYILPSFADADGNGLDDAYESSPGSGNGISIVDTDNDGDADYIDEDSDNDNVPDSIEGHDFNHDGVADIEASSSDQDQDGLDDAFEGSEINDGFIPNDEIIDPLLELPNTDSEDDVDYRDQDDDNDGIDTIDEDDNEDGDPTNDDCDEDLTPNYLDGTPCNIVPNGFSPNGDGKNDTLVIPALSTYMDFEMQVFNRQGNLVYEYKRGGALSPEWWDGRSSGQLNLGDDVLPAGTYFYLIKFNRDDRKPESGWVYLNK